LDRARDISVWAGINSTPSASNNRPNTGASTRPSPPSGPTCAPGTSPRKWPTPRLVRSLRPSRSLSTTRSASGIGESGVEVGSWRGEFQVGPHSRDREGYWRLCGGGVRREEGISPAAAVELRAC
jgi:hypothetical protein